MNLEKDKEGDELKKGVLLVYTLPGLERLLAKECRLRKLSVIQINPLQLRGRVAIEQVSEGKLAELRTCENCVKVLGTRRVERITTRDIRLAVRELLREAEEEVTKLSVRSAVYGKCFSQLFLKKILYTLLSTSILHLLAFFQILLKSNLPLQKIFQA